MILRGARERYFGGHRIVQYEPDREGRVSPSLGPSAFDEHIDEFYEQRAQLIERLEARVLSGELSPIGVYMELYRMTDDNVAARLRLSRRAVRGHMTPKGFARARVETLGRYAHLFDISVADLFRFVHLDAELDVEVDADPGRVFERLSVRQAHRKEG